ncbi:MAG: FAD-dependent oxidoreductase [Thermoguttaceae bacterium]
MMLRLPAEEGRQLKTVRLDADLAVVGGGMAGVCCAITAARAGIRVVLVQDRPVLGGNASSEVRLWVLGATSHMGNNNRWAREGGVIDELLVENAYRNPEGNPVLLDALLLDKVTAEPNLTLLLNTAVYEVEKHDAETIRSVRAFCSQNSTLYIVDAPLFCDASGDGVLGFLAGAAFRVGSESRDELGEALAPVKPNGDLLGHSLFFYTKDTGRPVQFVPPHFALDDIRRIPRYRRFNSREHGCQLWWIEYGGRLDTVHETETIKWELWKIVYGVWNHIKNSGEFPEAKTMTLEWVGMIPGKRESRRFEGDYMLTQQDLVEQRPHDDAVSYGGWAIDLHPADGVYSPDPGCAQWHTKGVYPIPFRSLYSRNIKNLFLAGRIISASHVAFGSTRVMATCAHNAQAVGMAAALCRRETLRPADLVEPGRMHRLQRQLLRAGQFIPGLALGDPEDLARSATLSPSSRLRLGRLPADGPGVALAEPRAMLLPMPAGPMPRVTFTVDVHQPTMLHVELRASQRPGNFTPDVTLATQTIRLLAGENQDVVLDFETRLDRAQ